jgi:hypothetical protein
VRHIRESHGCVGPRGGDRLGDVRIEIDTDAFEPPAGRVRCGSLEEAFAGWSGLLGILSALLEPRRPGGEEGEDLGAP